MGSALKCKINNRCPVKSYFPNSFTQQSDCLFEKFLLFYRFQYTDSSQFMAIMEPTHYNAKYNANT